MYLPTMVALAAVAALGYLVGHRSRSHAPLPPNRAQCEIKWARSIAQQLQEIADRIRANLAEHESSLTKFKQRISVLGTQQEHSAWCDLLHETEKVLKPTLHLAAQMSSAHDELRQQSHHLMGFTESRVDPLTGVNNRKALDDSTNLFFALLARYDQPFSLVIVDIDHFKQINEARGRTFGDHLLQSVARLLEKESRQTDLVFRYGPDEFVVLMPHTDFPGATIFADRIRATLNASGLVTISGGVVAASYRDDPKSLLDRAADAVGSAFAAGGNRVHRDAAIDADLALTMNSFARPALLPSDRSMDQVSQRLLTSRSESDWKQEINAVERRIPRA